MKQRVLLLMMISVLSALWPSGVVWADEISELKEQLRLQSEMLKQLQQRIVEIEARQKAKDQTLTAKIDAVAQKTEAVALRTEAVALKTDAVALRTEKIETLRPTTSADWTQRIKWSGDFRYRFEHTDEEIADGVRWHDGQTRNRIRARLMIEAIVNDEWDVAFRLASAGPGSDAPHEGNPTSGNQDLENAFSSKNIWLDLAFFRWHPASIEGLEVFGGKVKNPFYTVGKNSLIWDPDLNPEGISLQYQTPVTNACTLFINGGAFWVDEIHNSASAVSASGADISLWGIQSYVKHTVQDSEYVLAGASWFDYANLQGQSPLAKTWSGSTSKWFGNTTADGVYVNDYDLLELFTEYGTECAALGGRPVTIFGEYVRNTAATTGEDEGWLAGFSVNKCKDPGSWEFRYNYRVLEADAVVGQFTDSDFIGGGTDGKGHKFGFTYQLARNTQAGLTYFHDEDDADTATTSRRGLDYRRLQADLKFKFK